MYGELDIFEGHDDQFAHDGSSAWDNWTDDDLQELACDVFEEIPFGDDNNDYSTSN